MKITNRKTGHTFNASPKEAADFFYAKNAKGNFINTSEDYLIQDPNTEISNIKFCCACLAMLALGYGSFYLFLQFNY